MTVCETSDDPTDLLAAGRRAIKLDFRHDLAQGYYLRAIELARANGQKQLLGQLLVALEFTYRWHCPPGEEFTVDSSQFLDEALELFREIDDPSGMALTLKAMGQDEESLQIYRRLDDQANIARGLMRLANAAAFHQQTRKAARLSNEALAIAGRSGDVELLAEVYDSAGICTWDNDRLRTKYFLKAAAGYRQLGHRGSLAQALEVAAHAANSFHPALAEDCWREARALWHDLGQASFEATCLERLADMSEERGDIEQASAMRAESTRIWSKPSEFEDQANAFGESMMRLFEAMKMADEE